MSSAAGTSVEILQSWGVASARQPSGCTVSLPSGPSSSTQEGQSAEHLYDIPIGPSVVRWDIQNQKRVMQFQAHPDLVTGLCKSPNGKFIATSSYSGTVKLWTSEWVCLSEVLAPMSSQHYMAWSKDSQRLVVVGNGLLSALVVYNISYDQDTNHRLMLAWVLPASNNSETSAGPSKKMEKEETDMELSGHNYPYVTSYCMAEFNPDGNLFAVKELPYETAVVQLVSPDGTELRSVDLMLAMKEKDYARRPVQTLFTSAFHDGIYAVGVQGGKVVLVDAEKLDVMVTLNAGTGFRTCIWDGDYLLIPSDSGTVTWWSRGGEKVEEMCTGVQGLVVHMELSLSGNGLWICGINYIAFLDIERNSKGKVTSMVPFKSVHAHGITSVGVGFSPSGQYIGSGDILGNVWVTKKETAVPLYTCSVDGSVRCLCWISEDEVLVGTLSGGLYRWTITESKPKLTVQLEGSIICTHLNHHRKVLAVGTSTGDLLTYDIQSGSDRGELNVVARIKAHTPHSGPQDKRFGQLGKQAEVWNLCWSPDDCKLATCSEDQTVKVWSTQQLESLAKLTGHVLAVTCVDWIQCGGQTLLASCSDDRTVRLYDGESYALLDIVNSKDIYGWHTLTYLTFFHVKDTLALLCTTQNGHVVLWKVSPDRSSCSGTRSGKMEEDRWLVRLWKGKLHLGSIEGLAWHDKVDGGNLVTVGGDCIVNLFRFHI